MKKISLLIIGITVLGLAFFGVSTVLAQEPTPPAFPSNPVGRGPLNQSDGPRGGGDGILKEYMPIALASEFGLTLEELDTLHKEGITLWEFAQGEGLSNEEFQNKMISARQTALQEAVADGVLSQEQADWMLNRMNNFGAGNRESNLGTCLNGKFEGRGSGQGTQRGRGGRHW
ncbi:MAG: hypothetical protein KGY39_01595 [Anaerolineales bacterium]|nr:hypothetical protein [Anaerolineales bacterium]MBS3752073.1 hypothetical protein [Anaerolineales bacterium]